MNIIYLLIKVNIQGTQVLCVFKFTILCIKNKTLSINY